MTEREQGPEPVEGPERTPVDDPTLAVSDLHIEFAAGAGSSGPAREVVHGVDFELQSGRVLALVGESGSGKSVTAMSVLDLLPGTARVTGSIRLAGQELLGADPAALRSVRGGRVGTIFQEPMNALNPVFTIGNQIAEALRTHHRDLTRAQAEQRVLELLESVEVRNPRRIARAYPHEASGGQLQRAMIAMAIGNDPYVLIADEPTTALDVTVQAQILELIRGLTERLGTSVLLITHDMGVVADVADDVAVMRSGEIVEAAPAVALFARPQQDYTRRLLDAVPRLASLRIDETGRRAAPVAESAAAPTAETVPAAPAAELDHVSVVYHGRGLGSGLPAVRDVSLRIEPGETLGLVGESGSGKSTIGRTLAGLISPAAGTVRIDGIDLSGLRGRKLRRLRTRLGMVFQDPTSSLNPRHTIGRSIGEPIRLHSDTSSAGRATRVAELLDAVQLGGKLADRYPHELSGGQRQRVAIARALALRPSLVIADEPTSALDVSVQDQVLQLFSSLQAEYGFAWLFISHDLAVVSEMTRTVVVLQDGREVESGPTDVVLRSPVDPYTQRLLAAVPVADPDEQRQRREVWAELQTAR
ncbi:ABC transporter ATP-binding protein [Microlunatus elymi]|uniref:ABC transporter ATP-binding protein n=1 Tax=Microlunatus elymi TaxID=2596828 RepID=A0A516Q4S2_9ACTN|nr:ABC transporter ATP-binding protein [Microlunatus elymi]QDP98436.1 ABC transporter ATP-binding protein [Microlunatus elymi]